MILQCDDVTPEFHNRLAQLLREKVQFLMQEYLQSLPEGRLIFVTYSEGKTIILKSPNYVVGSSSWHTCKSGTFRFS